MNIKEGSFKLLMKAFRDRLSENIAEEPFLCRLRGGAGDDALREVDHFQTEVAREILGLRSEFSLIAALARDANAVMFVQDEEQALDLYAALINNLWERRNPHAHWMCSWREASRYIAYLRCEQSDLKYYGDPDRKAGCVTEEVQKLIGDLGWHDISPARYSQAELAALAPLLEHSRKEARSEFRKQTAKKRPDRPKVSED